MKEKKGTELKCCISGCANTILKPGHMMCTKCWKEYGHYVKDKNIPDWLKFAYSDTRRLDRRIRLANQFEVPFDIVFPDGDNEDNGE
jgi:hypothetical protein